ncbi:MAG: geranylgeranyl reductase family protein [Elusimicrobia bacterium]|nr:geranylgeranyl reductase family protein [Elusimicrobiota bacterium]
MEYDAIVVGAGPAGCAAAYDLAKAGRSVLLLDRFEFPRQKACAGGVTVRALKALRYSVAPVIRAVCRQMVMSKELGEVEVFRARHPVCVMTVRSEFDHYCFERTREAGAAFRVVKRIESLRAGPDGVSLSTEQGSVTGRYLIGADGANSRIRRLSRDFPQGEGGFAIEACVPLGGRKDPQMECDFGVVPDGYGWVFPKGDHLNVGVGWSGPGRRFGRRELEAYTRAKLGVADCGRIIGAPISLGGTAYAPNAERIFLVGDAAGLVDPLLGEGICNAIKSGQAAAAAVRCGLAGERSALEAFREAMAPIQDDLERCALSAAAFYRDMESGWRRLNRPHVRYALMKGYAAGWDFRDIERLSWRVLFARVPRLDLGGA